MAFLEIKEKIYFIILSISGPGTRVPALDFKIPLPFLPAGRRDDRPFIVCFHIIDDDLDQEIGGACQLVTFHDFAEPDDLFFELA
jgi:hypothetical protein